MAPLTIPSADEWDDLAGEDVAPSRQDAGLTWIDREPLDALVKAARLVSSSVDNDDAVGQLEREISDLADALSVQMTQSTGRGAVMTLFEQPRRGRHVRAFAITLPKAQLSHLEPADRLLFVRAALALRWPSEGFVQEREVLGDWFSRIVHQIVPSPRRRVIGDGGLDPLCLLAMNLPAQPFHQLRQRSAEWSPDLRQRWSSAEQLAALAGLT